VGTRYDALGSGGTVTIDFDSRSLQNAGQHSPIVKDFVSLNGTIVNCAGGLAFGDTGWITSEETTSGPAQGWLQKHGYNFFVPASAEETVPAVALRAMGRFAHEAAIADAQTGIVYQTEDAGSGPVRAFIVFCPMIRTISRRAARCRCWW